MNEHRMPVSRQQEQFSIAYIRAIASAAGFGIEETSIDIDSVDLTIRQYENNSVYPVYDSLRVQLKCTYSHQPKNGHLPYPLSIKNYNDLRQNTAIPRILIVLHVPKDIDQWLNHTDKYLSLYHCAYWVQLQNMEPTNNANNITVSIPLANQVTVEELKRMMSLLAEGVKKL